MKALKRSLIFGLVFLSACASYPKPSFKDSAKTYDKDFDTVWNASLKALGDAPIDRADKSIREISTKSVADSSYNPVSNVAIEKFSTVKLSDKRPFTVRVRVTASRKASMTLVNTAYTNSTTDVYSDEDAEKKLLEKIDELLR